MSALTRILRKRSFRLPLVVGLVAAGIALLPSVAPSSQERDRQFLVDPIHLAVLSAPAWFEGPVEDGLRAALREIPPVPLRGDDEVRELAERIAASSGWIASVERIEKRYPNRLEVEVALRRPVALAECESGVVLLDESAIVVAPAAEATSWLAEIELPLLHGPRPLKDAAPGTRARDRWLEEALRVAAELEPHRQTLADRGLAIAVLDVTTQDRAGGTGLSDVELYTAGGLVLEWGRASTSPRFGALEPTPDAKVRGLLRAAAKYPELAGIRRIRLQFADPYVVFAEGSPLAAAP